MQRYRFATAAICAISFAGHPAFAAETGGAGGKAADKATAKDEAKAADAPKAALDQANATHEAVDGAKGPALAPADPAKPVEPAPLTDLNAANARIAELESDLAKARADAENEVAALNAQLTAAKADLSDLRAKMVGSGKLSDAERLAQENADSTSDDPDLSGYVEVRVKSPMLVHP